MAAVTVTGMTVTVQAVMAGVMIGVMIVRRVVVDAPSGVMIGRQAVVVAQQANPPMDDRRQARPAGGGRPEGGSRPNRDARPNRDRSAQDRDEFCKT